MDSTSRYTNQEDLPLAAENPFATDPNAGYNSLYSSNQVPAFGSHWDLSSFQDPHNQSTVYQHADPGWQQNHLNPSNPPHVNDYGIQSANYGVPYPDSSTSFGFPTFNPQTRESFSTAPYDPLTYGHGHLLNSREFDAPAIADFARGSTQNGTVSPQVLQSYPSPYGVGVGAGVATEFQV